MPGRQKNMRKYAEYVVDVGFNCTLISEKYEKEVLLRIASYIIKISKEVKRFNDQLAIITNCCTFKDIR